MSRFDIIFYQILNDTFTISLRLLLSAVLVVLWKWFTHFIYYNISFILFFQKFSYLLRLLLFVFTHYIIYCCACLSQIYRIIYFNLIVIITETSIYLILILTNLMVECILLIFLFDNLFFNYLTNMLRYIIFTYKCLLLLNLFLNLKNTIFYLL